MSANFIPDPYIGIKDALLSVYSSAFPSPSEDADLIRLHSACDVAQHDADQKEEQDAKAREVTERQERLDKLNQVQRATSVNVLLPGENVRRKMSREEYDRKFPYDPEAQARLREMFKQDRWRALERDQEKFWTQPSEILFGEVPPYSDSFAKTQLESFIRDRCSHIARTLRQALFAGDVTAFIFTSEEEPQSVNAGGVWALAANDQCIETGTVALNGLGGAGLPFVLHGDEIGSVFPVKSSEFVLPSANVRDGEALRLWLQQKFPDGDPIDSGKMTRRAVLNLFHSETGRPVLSTETLKTARNSAFGSD